MTTDETTTLARTFLDDLDQLPVEIPGATNLEPGRISWFHGTNAAGAKMPGCFYAKDTAFVETPASPWALDERYIDQGEIGYSAPQLNIALIGWREQWFMQGQDRGDLPEWLTTYQDGAKYIRERMRANIQTTQTGQAIEVTVTHPLDPKKYDLDLTARTDLSAALAR